MSDMSEKNGNAPDISGILSGLLANPAALSSIASLLGSMGAAGGGGKSEESVEAGAFTPHPPAPPPVVKSDPRVCLLNALRPYLSPARCEMMDSLLRIFELLALLEKRR